MNVGFLELHLKYNGCPIFNNFPSQFSEKTSLWLHRCIWDPSNIYDGAFFQKYLTAKNSEDLQEDHNAIIPICKHDSLLF